MKEVKGCSGNHQDGCVGARWHCRAPPWSPEACFTAINTSLSFTWSKEQVLGLKGRRLSKTGSVSLQREDSRAEQWKQMFHRLSKNSSFTRS